MAKSAISSSSSKGKQKAVEPVSFPETTSEQTSKATTEIKPAKKPEKVKVRRIHVAGLPDITEQEARDRFKSFGEVTGVDGLGKLDATGKPLRYAFINIKTTKSKLSQCMNLLSGSMWKGSTLRIAEAKPTIMEKLEQERKQAAKHQAAESSSSPKKDKKRKREGDDEGVDEKLVTASNVKSKAGWKLDPATQTPIFPVVMRPDHPLPPPVVKEVVAGPSESKKDDKNKKVNKKAEKAAKKKDKKKKEAEKPKEESLSPPSRARLVKIDPTHWQPKHLREDDLQNLPDTSSVKNKPVKVKKEDKPAKKIAKAPTPLPESDSSVSSDEATSDSDENDVPETALVPTTSKAASASAVKASNVNAAVETAYDEVASLAERKANLDLVAKLLGGLPKNMEPVKETVNSQLDDSESDSGSDEDLETGKGNSIKDSGWQRAAGRQPTNISSSSTSKTQDVEKPVSNRIDVPTEATEEEEEVAYESEQSVVEVATPLKDKEDMEVDTAYPTPAPTPRLAEVEMQSLTEMFKPQEVAEGFSLGDLLDDFEVDELEVSAATPVSRAIPSQNLQEARPAWSAPAYASAPSRPAAVTNTLFFPFPLEEDERPGGLLYGVDGQEREKLLDRSWTGTSNVRRFKRTQNIEEITTHYESVRRNISEQVRKRHREAVKKQKKHGGKRTAQAVVDDV